MVFYWSLSDSKSPKVFRTPLSILVVLSNAVVWMVSNRPLTFKFSSPFNNPSVTVPKAPITIGITVTFMLLLLLLLLLLLFAVVAAAAVVVVVVQSLLTFVIIGLHGSQWNSLHTKPYIIIIIIIINWFFV